MESWSTLSSGMCACAGVIFYDFDIIRLLTDGVRGRVEVPHLRRERAAAACRSL